MINLIGINGYIGSGKDLTGKIIQFLVARSFAKNEKTIAAFNKQGVADRFDYTALSGWQVKKFAGKLKQIASIMTGIPVEKFEDQEFKKTSLPREWATKIDTGHQINLAGDPIEKYNHMTVREFLQKLGTEAIRNGLHTNAWVNATFSDYKTVYTTVSDKGKFEREDAEVKPKWILTDCRFPNEAQAVKDRGGIVIRVNRLFNDEVGYTAPQYLHPSETSLDTWNFDYVINNDSSLEDLTLKVKIMLEHFGILTPQVVNN